MLRTLGMDLDSIYKTNVFCRQPPDNDIAVGYGVDKAAASEASKALGPLTLNPTTYIADEHLPELDRLREEIRACNPNVILALGNTACWALLGQSGINNLRGVVHVSHFLGQDQPVKVLPTYHPAAVLRQWEWRVVAIADIEKARTEADSPQFRYDNSELWLNPTIEDLWDFEQRYLLSAKEIAFDVETKRGQITCLSLSPDPSISLAIPFWLEGSNPHYWSAKDEIFVWKWVKRWMESDVPKVMQNGMYDIQYCRAHGITPRNFLHDTMLMHHSLYSEMRKSLGFLGSIYCNVPSWKFMRTYKREEVVKKDD